jgi:hypothetical protein
MKVRKTIYSHLTQKKAKKKLALPSNDAELNMNSSAILGCEMLKKQSVSPALRAPAAIGLPTFIDYCKSSRTEGWWLLLDSGNTILAVKPRMPIITL